MNKTKIPWADMTYNPLTGCLHGCHYCYARKLAIRFGGTIETSPDDQLHTLNEPFYAEKTGQKGLSRYSPYPYMFDPTFHKYRLDEPKKVKQPQKVFVCSMADLFGNWIPTFIIEQIFASCRAAPQHKYLFLTKNHERYLLEQGLLEQYPEYWYGVTVTNHQEYKAAVESIGPLPAHLNTFLSIEPLLGNIDLTGLFFDWVIIGEQTNPKIVPYLPSVENMVKQCIMENVRYFMKEPLRNRFKGIASDQKYPDDLCINGMYEYGRKIANIKGTPTFEHYPEME